MCMECGFVGCCNSLRNKHAMRHFRAMQHPIARSIEPGENGVGATLISFGSRGSWPPLDGNGGPARPRTIALAFGPMAADPYRAEIGRKP
jgi:hypothetical protein